MYLNVKFSSTLQVRWCDLHIQSWANIKACRLRKPNSLWVQRHVEGGMPSVWPVDIKSFWQVKHPLGIDSSWLDFWWGQLYIHKQITLTSDQYIYSLYKPGTYFFISNIKMSSKHSYNRAEFYFWKYYK